MEKYIVTEKQIDAIPSGVLPIVRSINQLMTVASMILKIHPSKREAWLNKMKKQFITKKLVPVRRVQYACSSGNKKQSPIMVSNLSPEERSLKAISVLFHCNNIKPIQPKAKMATKAVVLRVSQNVQTEIFNTNKPVPSNDKNPAKAVVSPASQNVQGLKTNTINRATSNKESPPMAPSKLQQRQIQPKTKYIWSKVEEPGPLNPLKIKLRKIVLSRTAVKNQPNKKTTVNVFKQNDLHVDVKKLIDETLRKVEESLSNSSVHTATGPASNKKAKNKNSSTALSNRKKFTLTVKPLVSTEATTLDTSTWQPNFIYNSTMNLPTSLAQDSPLGRAGIENPTVPLLGSIPQIAPPTLDRLFAVRDGQESGSAFRPYLQQNFFIKDIHSNHQAIERTSDDVTNWRQTISPILQASREFIAAKKYGRGIKVTSASSSTVVQKSDAAPPSPTDHFIRSFGFHAQNKRKFASVKDITIEQGSSATVGNSFFGLPAKRFCPGIRQEVNLLEQGREHVKVAALVPNPASIFHGYGEHGDTYSLLQKKEADFYQSILRESNQHFPISGMTAHSPQLSMPSLICPPVTLFGAHPLNWQTPNQVFPDNVHFPQPNPNPFLQGFPGQQSDANGRFVSSAYQIQGPAFPQGPSIPR